LVEIPSSSVQKHSCQKLAPLQIFFEGNYVNQVHLRWNGPHKSVKQSDVIQKVKVDLNVLTGQT